MEPFFLTTAFLIFLVCLPILVGFLLYWIPKKRGYPKLALGLLTTYTSIMLLWLSIVFFQDQLFTKSDANNKLAIVQLQLNHEFKIIDVHFSPIFREHYVGFKLKISEQDKSKIITLIRQEPTFKGISTKATPLYELGTITGIYWQNYETAEELVREYRNIYDENTSTSIRASINKTKNTLTFEESSEPFN